MAERETYKTIDNVTFGFDQESFWFYQEGGNIRDKGSLRLSREQVSLLGEYVLRGLLARSATFDVAPVGIVFAGGNLILKTGHPRRDTGRRHLPPIKRMNVPKVLEVLAEFLVQSSP